MGASRHSRVLAVGFDSAESTLVRDLIERWEDAACAGPMRIATGSTQIEADPDRTDRTGQHTEHGFCIVDRRFFDGPITGEVSGADLRRLLLPASADQMVAR